MLFAVRDYLRMKKTATLQDIAWHFKQPPETVSLWVEPWLRCGKISEVSPPAGCGVTCKACKPEWARTYVLS